MARRTKAAKTAQRLQRERDDLERASRHEDDPDKQFVRMLMGKVKWTKVVLVAILALLAYVATTVTGIPTPKDPEQPDFDPSGKQEAYAYVERWLGDGSLGDGARIVSWDGSRPCDMSAGGGSDAKPLKARRHDMTVENADGRWWRVSMTVDASGLAVGQPSVEPLAVDASSPGESNAAWAGTLGDLQPSDALTELAKQWATAWMGNDPARLTTLVADPDPDASYQPLLEGDAKDTTVDAGAYLRRGTVSKKGDTSDRAVIRVTTEVSGSKGVEDPRMSYDLLIGDPDGKPKVLAWGAPGDGPKLKEYSNRWHGGKLDKSKFDANHQQRLEREKEGQ